MTATFNRMLMRTTATIGLLALTTAGAMAQTTTINGGGSSLIAPTYIAEFAQFDSVNPQYMFTYASVGSGAGQTGFLTNNPASFGLPAGTTVHFGASDAYLTAAQVTAYQTGPLAAVDGPLIQLPMVGVAVTIPTVNPKITNGTAFGTDVRIDDDKLCGIFSGKITNWKQVSKSVQKGAFNVAYRSDGSGTTFLLTQHLNAVCNATNSSFPTLPVPITTSFVSTDPTKNPVFLNAAPANFLPGNGSGGVQAVLLGQTSALGYLSPDYTSLAPGSANTSNLQVASVINVNDGKAYQPNTANTGKALNNPGPTASNGTPPSNAADAADATKWVPAIPYPAKGYPIAGYTDLEVSSCYADPSVTSGMLAFLKAHFNDAAYAAIINTNGFVTLASTSAVPYVAAVKNTFLTNRSGFNLNIGNASVCTGSVTGR